MSWSTQRRAAAGVPAAPSADDVACSQLGVPRGSRSRSRSFLHRLQAHRRAAPVQLPSRSRDTRSHSPPPADSTAPPPITHSYLEKLLRRGPGSLATSTVLADLNVRSTAPVGQHWDIDFLVFRISPSCLPLFASFWELGGISSSFRKGAFPDGLEIAAHPFTLRVDCSARVSQLDNASFAHQLLDALIATSATDNPTLARPLPGAASRNLKLAMQPRMVTATHLAQALLRVAPPTSYTLYICKYGFKVDAEEFFDRPLMRCHAILEQELGQSITQSCWDSIILDFATEGLPQILSLVFLNGAAETLSWVHLPSTTAFSLFGCLGRGFGGVTFAGNRNSHVRKVSVYPSGWVHYMKGFSFPRFPPAAATNKWIAGQKNVLESIAINMASARPHRLGGLRFEFRLAPSPVSYFQLAASWAQQKATLVLGGSAWLVNI